MTNPEAFARASTLLGPLTLETQRVGNRWRWQGRRIGEPTVVVRSPSWHRSENLAKLAAIAWAELATVAP